jgi:hypothetical protein
MNRAKAFERYWSECERPLRPVEEALPACPEIAGPVATASALRRYAEAIPTMDLDSAWEGVAARLETIPSPESSSPEAAQPDGRVRAGSTVTLLRPRPRWTVRAAFVAVAAMVALCTVSLRASPGSALYPVRRTVERAALALSPRDGAIHLRVATARLDDLLASLREGPVQAAPGLARSLVVNRAAAGRAGADLGDLDLRIALEVPDALEAAHPSIASLVRTILGDLLPPEQSPAQGVRPVPGPADHGNKGKGDKKDRSKGRDLGSDHGSGGGERGQGNGQQGRDDDGPKDPAPPKEKGPQKQGDAGQERDV